MRVALLHDTDRVGGAERYLADLCQGLVEAGHEVHVATPVNALVGFLNERLAGSISIHPLGVWDLDVPLPRVAARLPRPLLAVVSALRKIRPDILHSNNGGYPGSQVNRLAVLLNPVTRVMTVNGLPLPRSHGHTRLEAAIDARLWSALSAVITPAAMTGERLVELRQMPAELLTVIPYGISPPRVDEDAVAALRAELAPDGDLLIGLVVAPATGPDVRFKGHDVLLEAMTLVGDSVRAVIIGHDPGDEFRARMAQRGLAERISLHAGFRPTAPYMAAIDALVMPSTRFEALPLVILESMAASTPVIASRLSGIPEAVVDDVTGYLFEPGDHAALAAHIDALAADPDRVRRTGQGAFKRYEELFSYRRMVQATVDVYAAARSQTGH